MVIVNLMNSVAMIWMIAMGATDFVLHLGKFLSLQQIVNQMTIICKRMNCAVIGIS